MNNKGLSDKEASHKITNINVSITLTTSWQDTCINGTSIHDNGVCAIKLISYTDSRNGLFCDVVAGIMAWYTGITNSDDTFEIYTHESGLASNNHKICLRTLRQKMSSISGSLHL